jgi:hypothetical protein
VRRFPYLMKDMDKAVARIEVAIETRKHYGFGDYDVENNRSITGIFLFKIVLSQRTPFRIAKMRDMEFHLKGLTLQMTMAFRLIIVIAV